MKPVNDNLASTLSGSNTEHPTHTPGPWSADNGDSPLWGVFGPDGEEIAYMEIAKATILKTDDENDQADAIKRDEANARLIARAPDLLAENARLREALEGLLLPQGSVSLPNHHSHVLAARAALKG